MITVSAAPYASPSMKEHQPVSPPRPIHPSRDLQFTDAELLPGMIIRSEGPFKLNIYFQNGYECFLDEELSLTRWATSMESVSYKDESIPRGFERVVTIHLSPGEPLELHLTKLDVGREHWTKLSNIEIKEDYS